MRILSNEFPILRLACQWNRIFEVQWIPLLMKFMDHKGLCFTTPNIVLGIPEENLKMTYLYLLRKHTQTHTDWRVFKEQTNSSF